jgi:hypothetical protein
MELLTSNVSPNVVSFRICSLRFETNNLSGADLRAHHRWCRELKVSPTSTTLRPPGTELNNLLPDTQVWLYAGSVIEITHSSDLYYNGSADNMYW